LKKIEIELNKNKFWLEQIFSEFYMENNLEIKKVKEWVIELFKNKIENLNVTKNEILIKLDKFNKIESSKKWVKQVIEKFNKNMKWISNDSKKVELIKKFVDKIIINKDWSIKITFRFEDLWWDDKGGKKWGTNWGNWWKNDDFLIKSNNLNNNNQWDFSLSKRENDGGKKFGWTI